MCRRPQGPNMGFIVQASDDDGNDLGQELIEQHVNPPRCARARQRIRNQVESHLFHRFRKTGNHYQVVFEGDISQAEEIMEGRDGIPF